MKVSTESDKKNENELPLALRQLLIYQQIKYQNACLDKLRHMIEKSVEPGQIIFPKQSQRQSNRAETDSHEDQDNENENIQNDQNQINPENAVQDLLNRLESSNFNIGENSPGSEQSLNSYDIQELEQLLELTNVTDGDGNETENDSGNENNEDNSDNDDNHDEDDDDDDDEHNVGSIAVLLGDVDDDDDNEIGDRTLPLASALEVLFGITDNLNLGTSISNIFNSDNHDLILRFSALLFSKYLGVESNLSIEQSMKLINSFVEDALNSESAKNDNDEGQEETHDDEADS